MPILNEQDLRLLGRAKMESDRKNYAAKHDIMRRLIANKPNEFTVDSQEGGISGITHLPSMYRLHMPMTAVPTQLRTPLPVPEEVEPKVAELNLPGHIATTAIGGLLGTGLGYGVGSFLEGSFPPGYFEKHKLRNRLAVLGGAAGVAPGLWAAHRDGRADVEQGKSYWDGALGQDQLLGPEMKAGELKDLRTGLETLFGLESHETELSKEASAFFEESIPALEFNRAMTEDPLSPLPLKLMTTNIVQNASDMKRSPWVSPADIAHVAIGMGSGLAAGTTLGKVIGVLAGLTPEAQTSLQQVGMWYGAIHGALSN